MLGKTACCERCDSRWEAGLQYDLNPEH
jgi:hypothetical protein